MRIGVFGGTFDPPHIGHIAIAQAAQRALDLAEVIFVPAREPPHKLDQRVTPLKDRLAMLRLALRDHPAFTLSLIEAERAGPSYTVDTLRELRTQFPPSTDIFFIEGEDSLGALPTWHKPEELIRLCKLAVLQRPGYTVDLDALEKQVPDVKARVVFITAPEIEISSHELQARCREGQSLKGLVPDGVDEYITQHHLYE